MQSNYRIYADEIADEYI